MQKVFSIYSSFWTNFCCSIQVVTCRAQPTNESTDIWKFLVILALAIGIGRHSLNGEDYYSNVDTYQQK